MTFQVGNALGIIWMAAIARSDVENPEHAAAVTATALGAEGNAATHA